MFPSCRLYRPGLLAVSFKIVWVRSLSPLTSLPVIFIDELEHLVTFFVLNFVCNPKQIIYVRQISFTLPILIILLLLLDDLQLVKINVYLLISSWLNFLKWSWSKISSRNKNPFSSGSKPIIPWRRIPAMARDSCKSFWLHDTVRLRMLPPLLRTRSTRGFFA